MEYYAAFFTSKSVTFFFILINTDVRNQSCVIICAMALKLLPLSVQSLGLHHVCESGHHAF